MIRTYKNRVRILACMVAAALLLVGQLAAADGTETLGTPSLTLASGTGIVAAGIGLSSGVATPFSNLDGTIEIAIPAGATVNQVILYWAGQMFLGDAGVNDDASIEVNGNAVTGTLIGGPAMFFNNGGGGIFTDGYRADITSLGLVGPGMNSLDITSLDYFAGPVLAGGNQGAGVIVIIDEGGPTADLQLKDGIDLAFCGFPEPRKSTVPQTYTFASSGTARQAELTLFVGSVGDEMPLRTTTIWVTPDVGPQQAFSNILASHDGDFWDTTRLDVDIAAGASQITVEIISGVPGACTPAGASFNWIASALEVPGAPECGDGNQDAGEECDDGNDDNNDGCRNDCTLPFCGDGIPDPPDEECDDGNNDDNDMCRNDCTLPFCGDGIQDPGEQCDDGNTDNDDGCRNDCSVPFCGDGTLDPGEECDDGNNANGDGCSDVCTFELECAVDVQKLCSVVPTTSGLLCEARIASTTLRYTGPDAPNSTVVFSGKDGGDATYTGVNLVAGAVLTAADQGGFTVDARPGTLGAQTTITLNGVDEVIHTSCSAIYEAGLPAPLDQPKGDPSPNWTVVDFLDRDGNFVTESVSDPNPTSDCTIIASSNNNNTKKKKKKKGHKTKKKKGGSDGNAANQVEYRYVITNTGMVDIVDVFAFDDVLDREVAGSPIALLEPGESTTLSETVSVNATVTNTVFVSAATEAGAICEDEASATVTVEMPASSCDDGKPTALVFEYTGEACSDDSNSQDKDSCSGDPMGAQDVSIVITKDADKVSVSPSSGINIGDQITFSKNDGGRLPAELKFNVGVQELNIHASCSDDLIIGERFGSMVLVGFVPEN